MKRILLALFTLPAPALAEDAIIFADCGAAGCTCHISAISADEIALVTGQPTPVDAAQQTLVLHDGQFTWSRTPRDDLDLALGGDGVCEIEVFNEIIPQDGIWEGTVEVTGISGCHPQVAAMVPPMVEGMRQTQRIAWGGVFDPARLATGGQSPVVQWTRVRSDYFTGTVPMEPNPVLDVSVDATATLLAPEQAAATLTIRFEPVSAADGGALALIGMNGCEANAAYAFRRTAD
ncbi:hypothetical protein [Pseudotabrizicola algicola]|uniref:DUF1326 domain-containing protein n=1 Tax=Pseudotabrizicola algicola TaxID=2709381 RepID=A0A6B3RM84_9RHOB|nr:hypothetical protein [Pseudotabrizicola algicola]NEX46571.1 hypothetical protein [Pseudotabrizicola algicola]